MLDRLACRHSLEFNCIAANVHHARTNLEELDHNIFEPYARKYRVQTPAQQPAEPGKRGVCQSRASIGLLTDGKHLASAIDQISESLHGELRNFLRTFGIRLEAREAALKEACERVAGSGDQVFSDMSRRLDARLLQETRRIASEREASLEVLRGGLAEVRNQLSEQHQRLDSNDFRAWIQEVEHSFEMKLNSKLDALWRRVDAQHATEVSRATSWRNSLGQRCESLERRLSVSKQLNKPTSSHSVEQLAAQVRHVQEVCTGLEAQQLSNWHSRLASCEAMTKESLDLQVKLQASQQERDMSSENLAKQVRQALQSVAALAAKTAACDGAIRGIQQKLVSVDRLQVDLDQHTKVARRDQASFDELQATVQQSVRDFEFRERLLIDQLSETLHKELSGMLQRFSAAGGNRDASRYASNLRDVLTDFKDSVLKSKHLVPARGHLVSSSLTAANSRHFDDGRLLGKQEGGMAAPTLAHTSSNGVFASASDAASGVRGTRCPTAFEPCNHLLAEGLHFANAANDSSGNILGASETPQKDTNMMDSDKLLDSPPTPSELQPLQQSSMHNMDGSESDASPSRTR